MHISEGVLSGPVLAGGWGLTICCTALGLRKLDYSRIMTVAILSAAFFVASLVHLPIGPVSVHLILNGLLGVILGWAAFPAILAALLLQSVFFQYGGLVVLGVNTFNMALPAVLCGLLCRPFLSDSGWLRALGTFLAGGLAVAVSGAFTALSLALSGDAFSGVAYTLFLGHLPVVVVEGFVTMFAVAFLAKVQPEILQARLNGAAPRHSATDAGDRA